MNCSVVINARVNSTRLPNKLLRPFAQTTLLDIALDKVSKIKAEYKFLATCEDEIIEVYNKHDTDIRLLDRSRESVEKGRLSQDITFAHYKDIPTDHIMVINPCAPFVSVETYESALDRFYKEGAQTMTSVLRHCNAFLDGDFHPMNVNGKAVSSQGNNPIYEMSHLFHIFNKDFFLENGYFWSYEKNDPYYYVVDKEESHDIDDWTDFRVSEILYEDSRTHCK